jgi:hypothetical protein
MLARVLQSIPAPHSNERPLTHDSAALHRHGVADTPLSLESFHKIACGDVLYLVEQLPKSKLSVFKLWTAYSEPRISRFLLTWDIRRNCTSGH